MRAVLSALNQRLKEGRKNRCSVVWLVFISCTSQDFSKRKDRETAQLGLQDICEGCLSFCTGFPLFISFPFYILHYPAFST